MAESSSRDVVPIRDIAATHGIDRPLTKLDGEGGWREAPDDVRDGRRKGSQVAVTSALQSCQAPQVLARGTAVALRSTVVAVTPLVSGRFRNMACAVGTSRAHLGKGPYEPD